MLKPKLVMTAVIVAAAAVLALIGGTDSSRAVNGLHDLELRKVTGDTVAGGTSECQPAAPAGCGYNIILRNHTSSDEHGLVGIQVDPLPFGAGCDEPTAVLHGGSASPQVATGSPGATNIDGDTDTEFQLEVDVTIPANGQATVNVGVIFPDCGPDEGTTNDYAINVDLCHDSDTTVDSVALGLFGAASCSDGASDGGTDTAFANDAPVTKNINQVP